MTTTISPKEETEQGFEHVQDAADELGHLANLHEHKVSPIQALRKRPLAAAWALYAIFTCLLVSFENQASGMVLSIPEFRKDFGREYAGNYVLDADWQSAFSGGPIASSVIGTFGAGYFADKIGRKPLLIGAIIVSFAAVAMEFVATTNALFFGGKFVNGFVTGIILSVSVTYVGEVSEP
jgi:MFS family permease